MELTIQLIGLACAILAMVAILITNRSTYSRLKRLEGLRSDLYQQYFLVRMILEEDPYIRERLREAWPQYEHLIRKVDDGD